MLDVLLADDDANVVQAVSQALVEEGHRVTEAGDGAAAAELLSSRVFDLAICDIQMPMLSGLSLLRRIRRETPGTAVVLMTAYGKIPEVVESLRDGAVDFVTKPFDPQEFAQRVVGPIAQRRALKRKFEQAQTRPPSRSGGSMVAVSPAMRRLVARIGPLAAADSPVVVTGDGGAGKELVARTIHGRSPRRWGPVVRVDGAVLNELVADKKADPWGGPGPCDGWLGDALGGTLVLDGIERAPLAAQVHLARILGAYRALARRGANGQPIGVRLITLARTSLAERRLAGSELGSSPPDPPVPSAMHGILESLYYHLDGAHIHVPSLVERAADLPPLVMQLLYDLGKPDAMLSPDVWRAFSAYTFPSNVRELRGILEHALSVSHGGPIEVRHLPAEMLGSL
jgi:DNA-binding NtrC family response regulator